MYGKQKLSSAPHETLQLLHSASSSPWEAARLGKGNMQERGSGTGSEEPTYQQRSCSRRS